MDQAQTQLYFLTNELLSVQHMYTNTVALSFGSIEQLAMYNEATLKDLKEYLRKPPAGLEHHLANLLMVFSRWVGTIEWLTSIST